MKENYFLKTSAAQTLYEAVRDLPIIDFHNHVAVSELNANKKYDSLVELWLTPDPYKHRLMRICGVEEYFITGGAEPFEKFEKFCTVFPYLAGNPVYDWSRMELSRVFGIEELPTRENAKRLYDRANEMLASPEFSSRGILSRFGVEYQSPVANLLDDLSDFDGRAVAPSLRGDDLLAPTEDLKARLSKASGVAVKDEDSYIQAVGVMLDCFSDRGCRFADHSLDSDFFDQDRDGAKAGMLLRLGLEYEKRGWTLLLHMGAKRNTSTRLRELAGPAGGYAAAGQGLPISGIVDLLGGMERAGGLPDTVLFPLNMSDQAPLAVLQGSFSQDHTPSKVQLGPAWWWCDHALGIENTLDCISSFGVLAQFIGMTTDSRSILSFVRHDYFRRLLCSYLARKNEQSDWGLPLAVQIEIARKISYENAKLKINKGEI